MNALRSRRRRGPLRLPSVQDAAGPVAATRSAGHAGEPAGPARWVTVVGVDHDAGATTVAALLAPALARATRSRTVVVDACPVGGALASRTGARAGSTVTQVAEKFTELTSFERLVPHLHRHDQDVWVLGGTSAAAPEVGVVRETVAALTPLFGVGVLDCGPVGRPIADALLDGTTTPLVVAPVSPEGVLAAAGVLEWLSTRHGSEEGTGSLVALVSTTRHPSLDIGHAARLLTARGGHVVPVPWDLGLRAGRLDPQAVSDGTAAAVARLAGELVPTSSRARRDARVRAVPQ